MSQKSITKTITSGSLIFPQTTTFVLPSYAPLDENSYFPNGYHIGDFIQLIYLVRCEHPLHKSSLFTQLTDCEQSTKHTYIKAGYLNLNDIDLCIIVSILITSRCYQNQNNVSWCSQNYNNVSLSEIHRSLLYGFDLSWFSFMCKYCKGGIWNCYQLSDGLVDCGHSQLYYKWGKITALQVQDFISIVDTFLCSWICSVHLGFLPIT